MADARKNFLIGFGERLTADVPPPRRNNTKLPAYTVDEARGRLALGVTATVAEILDLPSEAKPRNLAVAAFTLHPEWIAKSYYPAQLLTRLGMATVGSRPTVVTPEKWSRKPEPSAVATTDLFVSGTVEAFERLSELVLADDTDAELEQLVRVEAVSAVRSADKVKHGTADMPFPDFYEVALHSLLNDDSDFVAGDFVEFANGIGAEVRLDRRIDAGDLLFVPVHATADQIDRLAAYSMLRVARPLSGLQRIGAGTARSVGPIGVMPDSVLDDSFRVAVLDGGLPGNDFDGLATVQTLPGVGAPDPDFEAHGKKVTSAALFGPIPDDGALPIPYATVDTFQVLDEDSESDPYNMFDVLARIEAVIAQQRYTFISLSIGPDVQCEDDDVHVWTSKLDELLSDGKALMAVAVGNNGEKDWASGNARILVPSDAANVLSVGAADSHSDVWNRASYSAIGPGRSPATVKPDLLHFGGDDPEPFNVIGLTGDLIPEAGTSFSAPAAIRLAAGIRAYFGGVLTPLTLKTLLVHTAENDLAYPAAEVGWGRLRRDVEDLISFGDDEVRVVYQGTLRPGGWSRATLPIPNGALRGNIEIDATLGLLGPVDTADPGNYTRGGLEVVFRPDITKYTKADAQNPDSDPFFQSKDYATEVEQRADDMKWQPILKKSKIYKSTKLNQPVFDIHYNARTRGAQAIGAQPLNYSLCITIRARDMPDLYTAVMRTFAGRLEALRVQSQVASRIDGL
ncbi:MAG TPA: S8 family peptidase [Galbitalea sp.]|jgi:hypothetical protein